MTQWAPKRFWKEVTIASEDDGFRVQLDGKIVKTPAKQNLVLPTQVIAERVAGEWDAVEDRITPEDMPWTRSANAAIDKVAVQTVDVIDHLIGYAGTDLLCYRAESPGSLLERQLQVWGPILDWCQSRFDMQFEVTSGVMPVTQPTEGLQKLRQIMEPMSAFHLTGFHDLVTLSGSYVLALAVTEKFKDAESAWEASRLDENWQSEQWGVDAEASETAEIKRAAFIHAAKLYQAA